MITPLTTSQLTLRRFRPDDGADLYEYLSDPRTYRFEPGEPLDRAQAGQCAAEMAASPDFWAVELNASGRVIGQIYLKQIEPPEYLTCELGYIMSPAYQHQGYGAEASAALVRQALTAGGMHRIVAHCNPENIASWRLLEKLGFRREALHRQDIFFRRDAAGAPLWTDTYVYALLAADAARLLPEQGEPTMTDHSRSSPLPARYAHTNLIAADWQALARFYEGVFGCVRVPPERDLSGPDIEAGTGLPAAHLRGVHLRLPGHGETGPTLEIFTYDSLADGGRRPPIAVNRPGLGHLAFSVPDVMAARTAVLAAGGPPVGEVVTVAVPGRGFVTWCYVTDPEGNVIELQSWAEKRVP